MIKSISPQELHEQLNNPEKKQLLLDVREPEEYEICHIENSVHIPMSEITRRTGELDQEQDIIVICHHGMRSMQVAMFLEGNGFSNISNLSGGIEAWASTIDLSMPRY